MQSEYGWLVVGSFTQYKERAAKCKVSIDSWLLEFYTILSSRKALSRGKEQPAKCTVSMDSWLLELCTIQRMGCKVQSELGWFVVGVLDNTQ